MLFCWRALLALLGATIATAVEPGIDLLASLQLHNTSRQGVTIAPGPQRLRPAFYLQGDYRDLRLPQSVYQQAVELLRHNTEFTVAANLRQEEANSGSIISFSHGFNRYLELQSSGRKDEIRLHYTSQPDSMVHVETFPYRLADNAWHKLAVSVSGAQVQLLVDCHPLYRRLLIRPPDTNFTIPQLTLWVGQRNNRHSLFKGALQDVRLITGPHGYLNQCPHLDTSCPTCGQFSLLQSTVEQLSKKMQELTQRLEAAEGRVGRIEECDCQKSCSLNGSIHADGATWQHGCQICSCVHGEIQCRPVQCPHINCKNPVHNPGDCCPSCLKQCYLRGTLYDHGDSVSLKQCVQCECRDGSMHCTRIDPETMCPPLNCPVQEQFSVPEECCKFCPDVDECRNEGGLDGHHCHSNTKCVNTIGGYECQCLPGHRRLDRFNCVEIDECLSGLHECDSHATCLNTQGSYHCQCHPGYSGDGYNCTPICRQPCLNGGECVQPDVCQCRQGYRGTNCELDLDECETGLHSCLHDSVCVNMPGWYYCRCKPGYRTTIVNDNLLTTACQDLDECANGSHTCHPSAQCINVEGGFTCTCQHKALDTVNQSDCKLSCMLDGTEVENGATISPPLAPCKRCTCLNGVLSCLETQCDCSSPTSIQDTKCCPQCDPRASCRHQELRHVIFRSGDRWIYQCQTCECLFGEIDCWPMECPPVSCSTPLLTPGDCCPRCHDDLCTFNSSAGVGQPCAYAGRLYDSGTHWNDPQDKCTACNCKDGRLCCSFNVICGGTSGRTVPDSVNRRSTNTDRQITSTNTPGYFPPEAQIRPTSDNATEISTIQNKNFQSTVESISKSDIKTVHNVSSAGQDTVEKRVGSAATTPDYIFMSTSSDDISDRKGRNYSDAITNTTTTDG
ncbi:protein kinase C-binding protein NELL2-like isoform X2 [Lycorma delicatula]|uniref:protein kinase C-binding protein NELL2-like isoform X2 n=1 Tax=Lycorma delicatula TaxID=130591 RepID=UPI003F50D9B0